MTAILERKRIITGVVLDTGIELVGPNVAAQNIIGAARATITAPAGSISATKKIRAPTLQQQPLHWMRSNVRGFRDSRRSKD